MAEIILDLSGNRRLRCTGLDDDDSRDLSDGDFEQFSKWTETYRGILMRQSDADALLELGREMYAWLARMAGTHQRDMCLPIGSGVHRTVASFDLASKC